MDDGKGSVNVWTSIITSDKISNGEELRCTHEEAHLEVKFFNPSTATDLNAILELDWILYNTQ